jgi:hypothetical protein
MAGKTEIGALNARITAENSSFMKVVDQSQTRLHDLAKQSSTGFGIESAGGMLKDAISNPLASLGGLAEKILPIGAALAPIAALGKITFDTGHHFHETTKRAEELGISAQALTGLTIAAKDRADEMQVALQHLERTIGEAAGGSKEAQAKFEALGVSWQDLEAMTPEAAFGRVNDRIREQGDAYQKAAAARAFYGRSGQQNMRLIEQGSGGIEAAMEKAQQKGLVPDAEFTKRYEEYLAAKRDAEQTLTGIKNKIAVNLGTPILQAATGGMKILSDLMTGYDYSGADKRHADQAPQRKAEAEAKAAATAKAQAQDRELKTASQALIAARDLNKELDHKIETEGMSAEAAAAYESRLKAAAASTQKLADAWNKAADAQQRAADRQERMRKDAELTAQAKSVLAEIETPMQKFEAKQELFNKLLQAGKISADEFYRAISRIESEMNRTGANAPSISALIRGSQADHSFGMQLDRDTAAGPNAAEQNMRNDIKASRVANERAARAAEEQVAIDQGKKDWEERLNNPAH